MDMNQVVVGVTLSKVVGVSEYKGGPKKTVTVRMKYDGLTMQDVFLKALDKDVISWQALARKGFGKLVDKGVVEVEAKAPGKAPQVDPEEAMVAKLASMSSEEQATYFADLMEKASK